MKDHSYMLSQGRGIYTYAWMRTRQPTRRCSVTVTFSLTGEPFEVFVGDQTNHYLAVAIKAGVKRACYLEKGANIGFQLFPSHPDFPRFRAIASPGAVALDRRLFSAFDSEFEAAYRGELSAEAAEDLFDRVLALVLQQVPKARMPDSRVLKVMELLKTNPQMALDQLAETVGISYFRLSHLFADEMGIPLRSYQLWRKVDKAMLLLAAHSTTEAAHLAGFADCAHLFRAFQELHAASPSYFLDRNYVTVIARCRPADSTQQRNDAVTAPQLLAETI